MKQHSRQWHWLGILALVLIGTTATSAAAAPTTTPEPPARHRTAPPTVSGLPLERGALKASKPQARPAAPHASAIPILMLPVPGGTPLDSVAPPTRPGVGVADIVAVDPEGDPSLSPQEWPTLARGPAPKAKAPEISAPSLEETELFGVSRVPAEAPTLADARWLGVYRSLASTATQPPGLWVSGPIDPDQAIGWAANAQTGATVRVQLIWSDAGEGDPVLISPEAARALGLTPDIVHEIGIYLPKKEAIAAQ